MKNYLYGIVYNYNLTYQSYFDFILKQVTDKNFSCISESTNLFYNISADTYYCKTPVTLFYRKKYASF
jgi:hypothetical protein